MRHLCSLSFPLFFSLFFVFSQATAQKSFDERYILSSGFTALMDFTQGPSFSNRDSTKVLSGSGFSLISYTITPRINLYEFSEHAALSLETPLSLSLHISTLGLGSVNVPVMVSYNYGAVATHYTARSNGFAAGAGLEYNQIGLLKFIPEEGVKPRHAWVQPVVAMAYRYRGRRYKAKEFNLKIGYGQSERVPLKQTDLPRQTTSSSMVNNPTLSVKFSFVRYINK
jgi:hypothetical protein